MKRFLNLVVLLISTLYLTLPGWAQPATIQTPQIQWLDGIQNPSLPPAVGGCNVHGTTIDQAGNVYATVFFTDSVLIGGTAYTQPIDSALGIGRWFLVKYSPTGTVLWAKPNVTTSPSGGLRTDAAGNLYCYGSVTYPFTLDGTPVPQEDGNYIVSKWSPAGTLLWYRHAYQTFPNVGSQLIPTGMRLSPTGDIMVAGYYQDSIRIGSYVFGQAIRAANLPGAHISSALVVLSGQTGAVRWAANVVNVDSSSASISHGMGTDAAGNRYLMGHYKGTIQIGAFTSPSAGTATRTYWAKFNPVGQCVQLRTFGSLNFGPQFTDWNRAVVAPDGYTYLTNYFEQPLNVGGVQLTPAAGQREAFLARLDPNGIVQEAVALSGLLGGAISITPRGIAFDDERVYVSGGRTLPGDPQGQQAFVAAFDRHQLNKKQWELAGGGSGDDIGGPITVGAGGQLSCSGTAFGDTIRFGSYRFGHPGSAAVQKGFVMKLTQPFNLIEGEVFVDANANGTRDAGEGAYPGSSAIVELTPGPLFAAAGPTGQYTAQVGLGTYSATLPNPPRYHVAVPVSGPASVAFSTFGNAGLGRSFALQPIANQQDVQVVLTLMSPARPGNTLVYDLQYRNVGTVALPTGTVALTHDTGLQLLSSSAVATVVSNTLTWSYANLLPGEMRRLRVVFQLPAATPLGTSVSSTATVTPLAGDLTPGDNMSTAQRTVIGSFDPNDIEVNHIQLNTQQVAAGEWLEYTIRFQNHGTDTAFTVTLRDTLPTSLLQMGSLQIVAASHNCYWGFNADGVVVVSFTSIRLPAQITNPIASDGFVRFRLRPVNSLVAGDQIPNRATIYFDYNPPMATNTALTEILGVTGLAAGADSRAARVWPNPASSSLTVEATRAESGMLMLGLLDNLGRIVLTRAVPATGLTLATLDVSALPAGLYLLRGEGAGPAFTQRVVVR